MSPTHQSRGPPKHTYGHGTYRIMKLRARGRNNSNTFHSALSRWARPPVASSLPPQKSDDQRARSLVKAQNEKPRPAKRLQLDLSLPVFETGLPRPQRGVLTTILQRLCKFNCDSFIAIANSLLTQFVLCRLAPHSSSVLPCAAGSAPDPLHFSTVLTESFQPVTSSRVI